ncbi:uncharacterized protein GGS22DRAFT_196040 [Annulohypoxylon maeteangense]|uniref:uncharacterized protein n=1 Tax=Annulohypoxylon maeteangense TaxID=1927788 RepID=UPI0020074308|nr:uncharacterized protein GGS22DRAFT_196040 [Annulohypoxylon maeteangense]KAI0882342.1 hypothetical protein GGS22DRAFT_196040 [Annulohypoxylon maeteangense]
MTTSLAQLGVQYMASTGSCVVDMAAMHSLFNSCSTFHIRIPENQHRIDVHSNMICIKPTQPEPGAYREQYMHPSVLSPTDAPQTPPKQQQKRPPSMEGPGNSPQGLLPGAKGGDGNIGGSMNPDIPDESENPSTIIHTYVRPAYTYTSTGVSTLTTQVTRLQSSALQPTSSPSSSPTTTTERYFITTTPRETPTTSPEQQPTNIPVLDTPPSPSAPASPEPAVPPPTPEIINAPPPPAYCETSYVKMDVTTIQTLDPHDLDLYLNLLGITGIGLDLDHGVGGLVSGLLGGAVDDDETRELHHELEHSYRVRCGVREMHGFEDGEWVRKGGRVEESRQRVTTTKTQTGCLEECEKGAIGKARGGEVKECLGAAFNRKLVSENCRYWTGGRDEFLPVERLRAEEVGEWDLVYL